MNDMAIQDQYQADYQVCYGCGAQNDDGIQLKSYWQGDDVIAAYVPKARERGIEGFVYGGLIASLIDCHAIATAAANAHKQHNLDAMPRYVTGSLHVDYKKPTPLSDNNAIQLRAWVVDYSERKAIVKLEVSVAEQVTALGEVVAVRIPDTMKANS
ncbi:MAG: PaaI family thioesterase [Arenicella sp.]